MSEKKQTGKRSVPNLILLIILTGSSVMVNAGQLDRAKSPDGSQSLETYWSATSDSNIVIRPDAGIDDYLMLAMKRSPALKAAYNDWAAAVGKSGHVGALPDPVFSYSYFVEHVETRVGPQEHRFGLRQALPWFGTLGAKKDMALWAAEAQYKKFEAARLNLFYAIKAAFYDYYYVARDIEITHDNLELLQFWESVARSKYQVGLKQHPDVIKVQLEMGKTEDHLLTLKDKLIPAAAKLKALLDLPNTTVLPIPKTISVPEDSLAKDVVMSAVKANNPDLAAMQNMISSADAGVSLAHKQSFPDFSLGVEYIVTGDALNPSMAESGKDPWMIGATVSLPLWFGKNSARNREALALKKSAEYKYLDAENKLTAFTEQVLFEHADARRKVKLYRDGLIPRAEQSLNASYAAYQSGETDFLNVLDAQRQLLNLQLSYEQSLVSLARKRAELASLCGKDLNNLEQ